MRKSLVVILVLSLVFVAGFAGGGASLETVRIEGVVTYDGRLPDPIPVSEAGTSRQLIEVDPKTKGLKDAVVWLEGVPEPVAHQQVADEPVVMDQQNFFFVPHVLAVRSGQAVEFRNSDVANHGVMASSLEPRNQFNVMIPFGRHHAHRFVTSKYPVAIGCPIHTAMAAWIFVFDHRLLCGNRQARDGSRSRLCLQGGTRSVFTTPMEVCGRVSQIILKAEKPCGYASISTMAIGRPESDRW